MLFSNTRIDSVTLRDIALFSLLASLKQSLRDRVVLKIKNREQLLEYKL